MDFLSRLIGGTGARGSKQVSNHPQQRLGKFKKSYNQALTQCHKLNNTTDADPILLDLVQTNLQRLTSLLEDDTRAPVPHLCLNFASSSFVYTAISRITFSLKHDPITREAVSFFTILIDSDEENLLATERFAETLMTFVDAILGFNAYLGGPDAQSETLELIFSIAAKIRLEPELLPVWFRKKADIDGIDEKQEALADSSQQDDFPLVHHFVGHVYAEGRAGDFARTGLLYILESASNSQVLEHWIAFSDLPTLMASGLGGLYSQLSRKLSIARPKEDLPLILALSDSRDHPMSSEADSFFAEELQARLSTFMSYLVFWQDVLEHCHSLEIKETLIDRFQVEFLEQILYPSLLLSSDLDGGSSVAVLTYLCRILDSVGHPDIIHLILHYLLALPGTASSRPVTPRSPFARNQQKPSGQHASDAAEEVMTPSFFNLTDLVLASCASRNPETVTAALRLVSVIVGKHHNYALSSLLKTSTFEKSSSSRLTSAISGELETLITIATDIAGPEGINEAYENSIRDSLASLEAHRCSAEALGINESDVTKAGARGAVMIEDHPRMRMHSLSAEDLFVKQLVSLLRTFFTNDIETNLGLTSTITCLALCPFVRLNGWLCPDATLLQPQPDSRSSSVTSPTSDPTSQDDPDLDAQELARIQSYKASLLAPASSSSSTPPLMLALHHLTHTVIALKHDIPEFTHLLAGRKRAFQGLSELEDEMLNHRNPAFSASEGIPTSPRGSLGQSREHSRSRPIPIPALSPSPASQAAASQVRSTSPRGRTLSILAGQGSPRSVSSIGAAKPLQSPKPFGSPASFGASPSFRPQLREETQRRSSRSPVKASRTMSPLAAGDGSVNSSRSASPVKAPRSLPSDQHAATEKAADEEIFDRRISFSGDGEYLTAENKDRGGGNGPRFGDSRGAAEVEGENVDAGEVEDIYEDEYRESSLTHVLTNAVILQEFVLELAAIIHVRAGLLDGEVDFGCS